MAHTVRIPLPRLGADELAEFFERTDRITTVRTGMVRTLENIKTAAQPARLVGRATSGATATVAGRRVRADVDRR